MSEQLTPEQIAEARLISQKAKQQLKEKKQAYNELVDSVVREVFPKLITASENLMKTKDYVYESFETLLEARREIHELQGTDPNTHTQKFSTLDKSMNVTIGSNSKDEYDDTVQEGFVKMEQFIETLGKDEVSSKALVMIRRLLSRSENGNFLKNRIVDLKDVSKEMDYPPLLDEAIEIIESARHKSKTSAILKAWTEDEKGNREDVKLSTTTKR